MGLCVRVVSGRDGVGCKPAHPRHSGPCTLNRVQYLPLSPADGGEGARAETARGGGRAGGGAAPLVTQYDQFNIDCERNNLTSPPRPLSPGFPRPSYTRSQPWLHPAGATPHRSPPATHTNERPSAQTGTSCTPPSGGGDSCACDRGAEASELRGGLAPPSRLPRQRAFGAGRWKNGSRASFRSSSRSACRSDKPHSQRATRSSRHSLRATRW